MLSFLKSPTAFLIFASAGVITVILGALLTALFYRGKENERYSPLNHFISELGEVGISRLAWVFNLGLILTGLCLMVASLNLGFLLNGVLSKIAMVFGVISAISLSLVGVFPMNKIKPHGWVAMIYFRGGLLMVTLFSLAIALQPADSIVLPRGAALWGILPIVAFGAFLLLIRKAYQKAENPLSLDDVARPKIWLLAILEWSIFLTMILWFVVIALGMGGS